MPAVFSALMLLSCALLVLRLPKSVVARPVAVVLSVVLALAGLDEATEIHEKLEQPFDVDWQLLYVPVFVVALVAWSLFVVALRRHGLSVKLVPASAGCWAAPQALEALQWEDEGPAAGYTWMMVTEEVLEMVGSALLLVALLLVVPARRSEE